MNKGIGSEGSARCLRVTLRGLLSCSCPCQLPASGSNTCNATVSQMSLKHFVHSAGCPSIYLCILPNVYTSQLMVVVVMLAPNTTCWYTQTMGTRQIPVASCHLVVSWLCTFNTGQDSHYRKQNAEHDGLAAQALIASLLRKTSTT